MSDAREEAQWVLLAQSGDREALEKLLRAVQPALHRYLRGLAGPHDADDLLQDVLVLIFRKLEWLRAPELYRAWAYRIASRAGMRHLKKAKRWQMKIEDEAVMEEIAEAEPALAEADLREVLDMNCLPPASRAVFLLHFQEELSLEEVAAVLGIPLGTVKSRLATGLAAARKQFNMERRK